MTAATIESPLAATAFWRITRVVRLHVTNPWTTLIMPAIVLAAIFLLSFAIWALVFTAAGPDGAAEVSDGLQFSGASGWIFFYMLVVAVQAVNLTFPLALGYGSTRRDFSWGSALTFVLLSAMWAIALTVLAEIERATDGWGIGGRMFTTIYFGSETSPWWERGIVFFCLMVFFFFVGSAVASVYVRWRATGLVVFFIAMGAFLVGVIALITTTSSWPAVGDFFVTNGALGVSLWLLVPTAVSAVAGHVILRRATPRT